MDLNKAGISSAALSRVFGINIDSYLAAELASVGGVLGNLHLLNLLTQRGTITSTVFANNSLLLCSLTLLLFVVNNAQ